MKKKMFQVYHVLFTIIGDGKAGGGHVTVSVTQKINPENSVDTMAIFNEKITKFLKHGNFYITDYKYIGKELQEPSKEPKEGEERIVRVLIEQDYIFRPGTPIEQIHEMFDKNNINSSHAYREASAVGYSKKLVSLRTINHED